MKTTPYPMDTSDLKKGDIIPVSKLREILRAEPGTAKYSLRLLQLKSFVSNSLANRGVYVTITTRHNQLQILTDEEANGYNMKLAKSGVRRIKRCHRRHARIDLSKLTPDQRLDWDKNALKLAMITNALTSATLRIPPPKTHVRIN